MRKAILSALAGVALVAVAIQLVPYGRDHANPPVLAEPAWDSPETRQLAVRACFDCHSNQTVWPWYSNVSPVSWLVQRHVDQGRARINYSEWHLPQREANESAESVQEGKMPLWDYLLTHPQARLSPEERTALVRGLRATFGTEEHGDDNDD